MKRNCFLVTRIKFLIFLLWFVCQALVLLMIPQVFILYTSHRHIPKCLSLNIFFSCGVVAYARLSRHVLIMFKNKLACHLKLFNHFKEQLGIFSLLYCLYYFSLSDPGQVRELQTLCDLIGERNCGSPASPSGQQELFPGSGIFISSFRLAAMNHASKPNCMRLFHALFDHFFTVEECQNAVPFGRPGNNPSGKEGKQVLDRKKVDGILSKFFQNQALCVFRPRQWE